jgi:rhodanese-related sulfurtransferase
MRRIFIQAVAVISLAAALMSYGCTWGTHVTDVDSAVVIVDYQKSVAEAAYEFRVRIPRAVASTEVRPHAPLYEERCLYIVALSKGTKGTQAAKILREAGYKPANIMELIAFYSDADIYKWGQSVVALDTSSFIVDVNGYYTIPVLDAGTIDYYLLNSFFDIGYRFLARR